MDEMPTELQVFFFFSEIRDQRTEWIQTQNSGLSLKLKESWPFDQGFQI